MIIVLIRFLSWPFKILSKWHLTFIAFFRYKLLKRIAWCHIQFLQGSSSKQEICLWSWDFWRIKVEEPEVIELWEHHLEASIILVDFEFQSNSYPFICVNIHLTYKTLQKQSICAWLTLWNSNIKNLYRLLKKVLVVVRKLV